MGHSLLVRAAKGKSHRGLFYQLWGTNMENVEIGSKDQEICNIPPKFQFTSNKARIPIRCQRCKNHKLVSKRSYTKYLHRDCKYVMCLDIVTRQIKMKDVTYKRRQKVSAQKFMKEISQPIEELNKFESVWIRAR